jgi:hypothetical protein
LLFKGYAAAVLLEDVRLRTGLQARHRVGLVHQARRVLVRDDVDRGRELDVAAHVIEVGVGVDDRGDGLVGQLLELGDERRAPARQLRVHQRDAVGADERRRVPAAAAQYVEVVAQLLDLQHHRRRLTAASRLHRRHSHRERAGQQQRAKNDLSLHALSSE